MAEVCKAPDEDDDESRLIRLPVVDAETVVDVVADAGAVDEDDDEGLCPIFPLLLLLELLLEFVVCLDLFCSCVCAAEVLLMTSLAEVLSFKAGGDEAREALLLAFDITLGFIGSPSLLLTPEERNSNIYSKDPYKEKYGCT